MLIKEKSCFSSDKWNFHIDVMIQLNAFKEYIKLTHNIMEEQIRSKINEYKELEKTNDMFLDWADYEIKINTYQLFYNSLFVSLFSFLEKKMYQLCKIAESQQTIKLKDISGQGVQLYKKYLMLVVKIDFEMINSKWSDISKLNDFRNLIIHGPSTLVTVKDNPKLVSTLKSIKGISTKNLGDSIDFYIEKIDLLFNFSKLIGEVLDYIYLE